MTPLEIEEGAELARRAALALVRGPHRVFFEALDADRIAARTVGENVWPGLTDRQRERLRALVRERFVAALSPSPSGEGEIAWSFARPAASSLLVDLGLKFGARTLKTRWDVDRIRGRWKVADITLSDPGLSLAKAAGRSIGGSPVLRRDRGQRALAEALPRLIGLAGIAAVLLFASRRLSPPRRALLFLTASAPALLFAIDGTLVVRRALSESYALPEVVREEPWRHAQGLALEAQSAGRLEEAGERWDRAVALGAPPAPVAYRIGQAARQRGDAPFARAAFERALRAPEPAPGAAKELALLAVSEGKNEEARGHLARYLREAGPDPDTLSLAAVVETNLGNHEAALEAIRAARQMVGEGTRGAELEAQVRARSGDAAGTVAALRPLEPQGLLDRWALRADPAYLPVAAEPAWVAFLAETPAPPRTVTPAPRK